MTDQRVYGRTEQGTREILSKTGRLTQSERLVLIVLGPQMAVDELLTKLPSLSSARIEQGLSRLIELGLAYEVLVAQTIPADAPALPARALQDFLAQNDSDPITVMATPEMLANTSKTRAIEESISHVLKQANVATTGSYATLSNEAVPLSKMFPPLAGDDVVLSPAATTPKGDLRATEAQLKALREKADEQIKALEAQLKARRAAGTGTASGARPKTNPLTGGAAKNDAQTRVRATAAVAASRGTSILARWWWIGAAAIVVFALGVIAILR